MDASVIRVNGQQCWLYAAVDSETNEFLHVRLFPALTTQFSLLFFRELRDKQQVEHATFLVDGAQHFHTDLCELLDAYLGNPDRNDVTDEFGRHPLLTTGSGRATRTTIRRDFYKLSRPCYYSDDCPHDRSEDDCEATNNRQASKCESSFSPHPLRRWSIEHQLDQGVSKEILSDRVDVSVPVLDKHYDRRTEERKRRSRLDELSQHLEGYNSGEPNG